MDKTDYQFEIMRKLEVYYDSHEQALEVYNTPHLFFTDHLDRKRTMAEMVELGKGNEVLEFIEDILQCIK